MLCVCSGLGAWFYAKDSLPTAPIIEHDLDVMDCENCQVSLRAVESDLHTLKQDCEWRASDLEQRAHGPGDLFSALGNVSRRSVKLLGQVCTFTSEKMVAVVWPWPEESLVEIPDFDAENLAFTLVSVSHAATVALGPEMPELPELPEPLLCGLEAVTGVSKWAAEQIHRTRPWFSAFRKRFPEQHNFDGGREPYLALPLLLLLAITVSWQLYGLWILCRFGVRGVVCCPCRTCRRLCRQDRLDGEWEANHGEMLDIRVHFDQGLGTAELKLRDNNVVVLSQGRVETTGRFANGRLLWDSGEVWSRKRAGRLIGTVSENISDMQTDQSSIEECDMPVKVKATMDSPTTSSTASSEG